jgi:hypothetical protein
MKYFLSTIAIVCAIIGGSYLGSSKSQIASASVYGPQNATTTSQAWSGAGATIKTGPGVLGSIIVGNATAVGTITIYDATSSQSSALYGTTTLAVINTGSLSNTYIYDVAFTHGLWVVTTGAIATSTITFN